MKRYILVDNWGELGDGHTFILDTKQEHPKSKSKQKAYRLIWISPPKLTQMYANADKAYKTIFGYNTILKESDNLEDLFVDML